MRFWNRTNAKRFQFSLMATLSLLCVGMKVSFAENDRVIRLLKGHERSLMSVDFSADGKYLASADYGGTLIVWETENWTQLHTLSASSSPIYSARLSNDNTRVAAATASGKTFVWHLKSAEEQFVIPQKHSQGVVRWSLDDKLILTASNTFDLKADIKLWHSDTGRHFIDLDRTTIARDARFLPDGKHVAATSLRRKIEIFEIESGKSVQTLGGFGDYPSDVSISDDGGKVIALTNYSVTQWDMKTTKRTKLLDEIPFELDGDPNDYDSLFNSLAYCSTNELVAVGRGNHKLELWDLKNDRKAEVMLPCSLVTSLDFNNNGSLLAAAGWEHRKGDEQFLAIVDVGQAMKSNLVEKKEE